MDPTLLLEVIVTVIVIAGGVYLFVRWKGRGHVRDAGFYHFRCPGCGRRLRFQSRQVGRKGQCSRCGKDITFPAVSQSID